MLLLLSSFFTLDTTDINSILSYTGDLWDNGKLLFLLLIGVFLAFWIVESILNTISAHWYTKGGFEDDPSLTEEDKEYYRRKNI